ncbi:diguanylate cyclase [Vibrio sp. 10N.261.46.E11]
MKVSKRIEQVLSTNDVLARWGGEEFVLLLAGTQDPDEQAFKGHDSNFQLCFFCLPRDAFLHTLTTLLIPIQM